MVVLVEFANFGVDVYKCICSIHQMIETNSYVYIYIFGLKTAMEAPDAGPAGFM
jgi:hypothetical protein